ncbi:thiamine pyrophosphate protein [Hypericibacter adhaerens]|uniref:Thiamine pyrophosphate protein n=1 Tax=Hypericibacter adhaerens TaxID=2602016 RepID=A0A5J6N2E9_9PROT|nr:thiamine pyrophosphate-binding protein [Hypericibacter adhaerens]QEX24132.1 thiamine pyrophosphate protein [Hypericibacter adhaerens]
MTDGGNARTGGQILVDQLAIHGVSHVFCVPGESYLAALDAFHDHGEIRLYACRQEGGAANMAEAYGKLTGRPGICFVTRGPGATNASIGVHTAFQDSTPMILFIGQVARDQVEREAFQEIDFRRMFGPMAKWVAEIDDARRIPELVSQAFHRAVNGRPGPVVIALPEDMLTDRVAVPDAGPYKPVQAHPGAGEIAELRALLAAAKRPFVLLGGGGWNAEAVSDIQRFAETNALPVGCSFRCQDLFDNRHASYAGDVGIGINPALAKRIKESDLLIVVGARLGEMTTSGYTLIDIPVPKQKLVHIHPGAEELGRVYQATLPINSGMPEIAAALKAMKPVDPAWAAGTQAARADYLAWTKAPKNVGDLQMGEVVAWLNQHLPEDTILCNGAGNYATWLHRFFRYRGFRTQLAPTNGAMGYGFPAAIAAKAVAPGRPVVCFAGDGCFLMTGQELATAVQYGIPVITVVVNNGMYGTIRMHQERHYPARVIATDLHNPDFAALARAYGAHGETVTRTEEFAPAFERARASGLPALVELRIDPEALTVAQSLSQIRAAAMKR